MNVLEKQAWYTLTVIIITTLLYFTIVAHVGFQPGTVSVFALFAFVALTIRIGHKERKAGKIIEDERDREIARKATVAGYSVFWMFFVAGAMTPFFIYGPYERISIATPNLGILVVIAMGLIFFVRSLAIVILYRKDANA